MTRATLTEDERQLGTRLERELDAIASPREPQEVARRAIDARRPRFVAYALASATVGAALVVAIVAAQLIDSRSSATGAPGMGTSSASPGLTKGPIPWDAWQEDGTLDREMLPDFVPAADGDVVAGWARSDDVFPAAGARQSDIVAVYAEDLQTLVGHMYPDIGYVPLGADPSQLPSRSSPEARESVGP